MFMQVQRYADFAHSVDTVIAPTMTRKTVLWENVKRREVILAEKWLMMGYAHPGLSALSFPPAAWPWTSAFFGRGANCASHVPLGKWNEFARLRSFSCARDVKRLKTLLSTSC